MNHRITLREVAKAAGVHFTTAGLALRHDHRIRPVTIAKVEAAANTLGYTPNAMLSALSAYRRAPEHRYAGTLAYVFHYAPSDYSDNLAEPMLQEAARAYAKSMGFNLETFQISDDHLTSAHLSRILQARGIQGILLPPRLPSPGPIPHFEWGNFSTVAIGYSITNVAVHRACIHHAHNMRLCLRKLRERGYKRIGLILREEFYERSFGIVLGSYLAEQYLHRADVPVTPLFAHDVTKVSLGAWLKKQHIDCVLIAHNVPEVQAWIVELGYRIPDEIGLASISLFSDTEQIAGIDEQLNLLGEAASDCLISLLRHNERGLPNYPRYSLIEGRWVDRPTVRAATADLSTEAASTSG